MNINDLINMLLGRGSGNPGNNGANNAIPPDARDAALNAARQTLAPKQSDESHLLILEVGPNGDVLQQSEEWAHEKGGLKAVTREVRVRTCTGELVKPKDLRVICAMCQGHDSVVTHCSCGVALCRRCLRHHPGDGSPQCPSCHYLAVQTFNTWKQP